MRLPRPARFSPCVVAFLTLLTTPAIAQSPPTFSLKWGSVGAGDGQFAIAEAIAVGTSGDVFVVDRQNYRVQKFDANGGFLLKWGVFGSNDGEFDYADGIDIDAAGNVYVADATLDRVQKFDSNGTFVTKWGTTGSGNGQLDTPRDVAVDDFGNVYVADGGNFRVQKFTTNGTYISQFSTPAWAIATNSNGEVYVGENTLFSVRKFDSTGTSVLSWGSNGTGDGEFGTISGVEVDATGDVYVVDYGNDRVQKFDANGTFLTKWGTTGSGDGQFSSPSDIAINGDDLYVADGLNDRVQKFVYTLDLAATLFTTPAESRVVCDPLPITMTVANVGSKTVGAFDVTLRASEDSTITGGDYLLTTFNLSGMGGGEDTTLAFSQDMPLDAPRGALYLGVIVDDAGVVSESEEANNTAFNAFTYHVPLMEFVRDVPSDQGGQVYCAWWGSPLDSPAEGGQITEYSFWRAIGPGMAASMIDAGEASLFVPGETVLVTGQPLIRAQSNWCGTFFWQMIGTEPVWYIPTYGAIEPSLFDSTSTSPEHQYFQVIAHTSDPLVFYTSNPDSGRSVDNIGPAAPMNFVGNQEFTPEGLILTWDPNAELDLEHYALYKSLDPDFVPGSGNLEAVLEDETYFDSEWRWNNRYYYKLSAVDTHENESDYALVSSDDVTAVGDDSPPAETYLFQNHPNPFNPTTMIRFGVAGTEQVTVNVYDVSGRLVRTLLNETKPPGRYFIEWDGKNDSGQSVASGIYIYRLTTKTFNQTRKMTLLR